MRHKGISMLISGMLLLLLNAIRCGLGDVGGGRGDDCSRK